MQYDFKTPQDISGVAVYWFDDTGHGQCRVPTAWQVLYRAGDSWKRAVADSLGGVAANRLNPQSFSKINTTALRLNVKLQNDFSGGILEWEVK